MSGYPRVTAEFVQRQVEEDLSRCTAVQHVALAAVVTRPHAVVVRIEGTLETYFSVAQVGSKLLVWDNIEEGFEWAIDCEGGCVELLGASQFELCHIATQVLNGELGP
jgi:hypothetical protein